MTDQPAIAVLFLPEKDGQKDRFAVVLSNWPSGQLTVDDAREMKDLLGAVAVLAFPHEVEVR